MNGQINIETLNSVTVKHSVKTKTVTRMLLWISYTNAVSEMYCF